MTIADIEEFRTSADGEPLEKCVRKSEIAGKRFLAIDGEYVRYQVVKFEDIRYVYIPKPEPEPNNNYVLEDIRANAIGGVSGMIDKPAGSTIGYIFSGKLRNTLSNEVTNITAGKIYVDSVDILINPNSRFSYSIGDYDIAGEEWYGNKLNARSSQNNSSRDMAFGLICVHLSYEVQPGQFLYTTYNMYVTQNGNVVYYRYTNLVQYYTDGYDMILADGSNYAYISATVEKYRNNVVSEVVVENQTPYFSNSGADHYKMYCDSPGKRVCGENLGTTAQSLTMVNDVKCYCPVPEEYRIVGQYDPSNVFNNSTFFVYQERNRLAQQSHVVSCTMHDGCYYQIIDTLDRGYDTMVYGTDLGTTSPTRLRVNSDGTCWYITLDIEVYSWYGYTSGAESTGGSYRSYDSVLATRIRDEKFQYMTSSDGADINTRNQWICVSNQYYPYTDDINSQHQDVSNANAWLRISPNYQEETRTFNFYATCADSYYSDFSSPKKYAQCQLEQWRAPKYEYSGRVESYSIYYITAQTNNQHTLSIPYDKYGRNMTPQIGIMVHLQKGTRVWKNGDDRGSSWQDDDGSQIWDSYPFAQSSARVDVSYPGGSDWIEFMPYNDPSGSVQPEPYTYELAYVENLWATSEKWWGVKLFPAQANLTEENKTITIDITYQPESPKNYPVQDIRIRTAFTITHECQGAVQPTMSLTPDHVYFQTCHATSSTLTVSSNVTNWSFSSSTPSWLTVTRPMSGDGILCTLAEYTDDSATSERTATAATYVTNEVGSAYDYAVIKQRPPYHFKLTTTGSTQITFTDSYQTGGTVTLSSADTTFTLSVATWGVTANGYTYGFTVLPLNATDIYDGTGGPIGAGEASSHTLTAGTITLNNSGNRSYYTIPLSCPLNMSTTSTNTINVQIYQRWSDVGELSGKELRVTVIQEKREPPPEEPKDFLSINWVPVSGSGTQFNFAAYNRHSSRPLRLTQLWYYYLNQGGMYYSTTAINCDITIQPGTQVTIPGVTFTTENPYTPVMSLDQQGLPSEVIQQGAKAPSVYWAD